MLDRSKKPPKRPRDPNQLAYQIMLESTGQVERLPAMDSADIPVDPNKNPHAVALGRLGGLKGGDARAALLSPRKRSEIAAKAVRLISVMRAKIRSSDGERCLLSSPPRWS